MNFFRNGHSAAQAHLAGDIPIPFRKVLLANESDFEVPVHRTFCKDRCFSFSSLSVVPSYFEEQAAKLDLDTDAELNSETNEYVDCRAGRLHQIRDIMEGTDPNFERTFKVENYNDMALTSDYVDRFNNFFLENKPPHLKAPAFYMDWMDARFYGKPLGDLYAFVKSNFADYYVPTAEVREWTPGVHDAGLPAGLKDLPDANCLNFPSVPFRAEILDRIYLRLHLAPMTKLISSTANILNFLGFDVENERARNTGDHHSQIVFLNDTHRWKIIIASRPMPQKLAERPVKHKIRMGHALNEVGAEVAFGMSERSNRKNALLLAKLEAVFARATDMSNIRFGIDFAKDESKFKVRFPPDVASRVLMSPNLQNRLGMGSYQAVYPAIEPQTRLDPEAETKEPDSLTMARALVLDTGISICTPARGMTSSAMFLADNYMVMLHPTVSGTLETKDVRSNPVVLDDEVRYGSENVVQLRFRLHRYLNNGEIVPFGWKVNSYVTGILLCTPKLA
jgi:hypothetical protein